MKIFKTTRIFICKCCGCSENIEIYDQLDFDCPNCTHPLIRYGKQLEDCLIYSTNPEFKVLIDNAKIEVMGKINPPDYEKIHADDIVYFSSHPEQYEAWLEKLSEYNKTNSTEFKSICTWIRHLRETRNLILKEASKYTPVEYHSLSKIAKIFKIKKPLQKNRWNQKCK